MGTRIYPTTRNAAIIEIIAGVPAGTFDSLTKLVVENGNEITKAKADGADYSAIQDIEHKHWDSLHDRVEGILDSFLTLGWGKFTSQTLEIIRGNIPAGEDEDWVWNGGTKDVGLIDSIMEAQGVDLEKLGINPEDLEGLSWG
jgi:hypothetical protein